MEEEKEKESGAGVVRSLIEMVNEILSILEYRCMVKKPYNNLARRLKLLIPLFEEIRNTKEVTTSGSVVRKFRQHVAAHEVEHGDQIRGFCISEVGYGIYGVGFVTRFMKTHRSKGRLGLLMVLYLQRLSLLMAVRQRQILGSSRDLAASGVIVVDLCSR
nr:u-box domain-containing protein 13 [Quercus suber]